MISDMTDDVRIGELGEHWKEFKSFLKVPLDKHCETCLNVQMFHLLLHVVYDLERFGCLEVLDASLSERSNKNVERAFRTTCHRPCSDMAGTGSVMHISREKILRSTDSWLDIELLSEAEKICTERKESYLVSRWEGYFNHVLEKLSRGKDRIRWRESHSNFIVNRILNDNCEIRQCFRHINPCSWRTLQG